MFEMKSGQRILFEGNVLDTNYHQAQETAINIKIGDEDGRKTVHNVTVRKNIIRNAANGIKMCASQCNSAANTNIATGLAVYNNIFENVSTAFGDGGDGNGFHHIITGPGVWVDHNTFLTTREGIQAVLRGVGVSNGQTLLITNNIVRYLENALTASEVTAVSSAAVYTNNLIVGGTCSNYPTGNRCPANYAGVGFVNYAGGIGGDYNLAPTSPYKGVGSDPLGVGTLDPGANVPAVNAATACSVTGVCDSTPPTVSLTAPANGATVSGTVALSANASDNLGVAGVQFLVDGTNVGGEDTTAPYTFSWNSATVANGARTITARARDIAGLTTLSAVVTVTVQNVVTDTTPPTVSMTAPANGATVTGTVTVSANASDNVGVAGVQFLLDGANLGAEDTGSPFSVVWNTATAAPGAHALTARARDAAGNTTTSAIITVTIPDTTAPVISVSAPANGATVSGTVAVSASASDNVAVVGVQFLLDGANLGAEDTSSPYSVSWNTATASIGTHTLTARARDAAGNTTTSATVTVTVPDTTGPTVSVTAPANGAAVTGTITVSAVASDNVGVAGVQFLLDGANLGVEDTGSPYSVSWNTAIATLGTHTLTARARDAAGNMTTSAAVTVTVSDATAPTVSISTPANGATVTGTVTVSASASDNVGVAGVQFLLDGVNLGAEDTTSPYSASWNTATATMGTHTLTARARDAAGNTTTSAAITVTVPDTTAPAVSLTAPANGATVSGVVSVTASATDNVGLVGVQFLLDGANLGAEDTSSPYSVSWNTATAIIGTHTLAAIARDAAGNTTTSAAITVTVPDAAAPTVSLTAPANGATVTGTVTVSATASDNVGVAGVQFLLDGVNLGAEDTSSPYSVSWNTATAAAGSHTLTARARDAAGNTTTSTTITVTVPDATGPTVSISAPANGATVTGTVTVSATASDNVGVAGVQFRLDGVNLGAEDTSSPYSVSWNAATATIGSHSLTAVARDAAGNTTTSATITVTVPDTAAPAVSVTAPANGATVTGTVTVSASASDNVGVAGVQFRLDGANLGAEDTSNPYSVSWNTATATIGSHTLTAVARDAAGNTTTSATITVTVSDTTAPAVSLTAPANGATVTGTVTVSATASDNVGVAGVQFLLDGANLGAEDTSSPYSTSWNAATATIGTHTLTARARDAAGNTTTSATITVTVPDTTAPTVSVSAPANGATVTGPVAVSASASDNVGVAGVQFLLDGVNLGAEDTSSPYAVSWNTATAAAGSHTLTARARDAAGNTTTSATITVTVPDTTAPAVSLTAPANGATVSGVVSMTASATDNVGVAGVQFLVDGVNVGAEDTSSPYSVNWNTATATTGTHTLSAVARDAAGNTTTSATITVTVPDATAPTVAISAPANGATVTGTVAVSATASDNVGVVGVQFLLDGVNLGAEDTSSPYSVNWNTATAAAGSHTLTARARDAAGNTTTSAAITVTVPDVTAPTVSVTAPANGATVSGVLSVTASAADNVGVAGVQFLVDGVNLGAEDITAPYSVSWSTTTVANGSHTVTAVARDAAGNTTTSPAVTVTVQNADTTPPAVSVTAPANGATVGATVSVSASASDNVGVAGVQFLLDGVNLGAEDTSSPYSISWNTTTVTNGSHTLTALARDAAGNTATSTAVIVTVQNTDATPPAVSLTAPANGATVTGTVTVSASASDNVGILGVQFLLDGVNLGAEDTSSPYSVGWNTATATVGTHTLTARARDAAGNTTTSAPITVTVPDTTGPAVSIAAPAQGATVSGTVAVSASASDNVGVAGVQFRLNGVNLGAEDTSSPYSVSWDTTAVTNGSNTLTAVARDAAGNTTTSTAAVVTVQNLDITPPTVSLTAPANGATVTGTVTVSASASDNVGVVGVQFLLDGANLGAEDTSSPYSVSWNTATATVGTHTLTARARDADGNTTTSTAITVTVPDTAAPAVSISAPANGAAVSGTVAVSAGASDNVGVVGVQFLLDGVNLGAEDTSSPYSVSWNTASATIGSHTLTAVARDAAGNTTTSSAVTVTVSDTAAPAVSVTAPANGATVTGTVTVSATASDNVGVVGVQFLLDGVNLGAEDTSSPYSVSWNTATATVGTHTLTARARDAGGNTTTSETITVTVPDTTAPTVSLTAPANGAIVTGTVTVSATASDNAGVVGVQFLLDGANLGAEDTSSPYSVSWNAATAAIGPHTLTAVARDAAGNTTASTTITVTVPDTAAPTVSVTEPANGATVTGSVSVSASASDNVGVVGVQFLLDGANLGAEDTSSPYSVSWNTATAAAGSHTLTARARDAAGNTTTSTTITVTVPDTTAPTVSMTAPANGAIVTGTVTVSATASDNVGIAGVQFFLDGANLGAEDTASPFSVSWNTTTFANGTHLLTAVARDVAGNTTASAALTVTVQNVVPDTTPPTVSLTAPASGATVSGTVTISADAADNVGVAGVQFRLDGVNLGAEVTSSPHSFSWNSTGVPNGPHTLAAVARDAAGNTTTAVAVTVTVSNSTPAPPGLVAAFGYNESGGVSAFDSSPTGATATLIGATWAAGQFGSTLSTNAGGFAESTDADAVTPPTGVTISAWVFVSSAPSEVASIVNKWDGSLEDEYFFGLTPNRNPYFSWHTTGGSTWGTPAYGEVAGTGQVPMNAWTHIAVVRSGAAVSFYVNGVLTSSSSPMDAHPFRNGSNSLRVGGQNRGGANRQFPGRIDELRIYTRLQTALEIQTDMDTPVGGPGDTTPPSVDVTSPPNGGTVSGTFMIAADAADNVGVFGVQFKLNGVNMGAEDRTAPFSTTFVTAGVPNGVHTLTAVARDAAGNTTTSAPITVTVQNIAPDTVPPAVSLIAPANGATVSGAVTLSATASDNVGVVGVQFRVDGVNVGAEDTSSPFSASWITEIVADGAHTITAVARDAAGNTTVSAPRTVTVSNGAVIAGLIAAYAFDEGTGRTPVDSSPLGNRGTLMGGASWAPGRYGTALALNATGFAEAVDLSALTPGTSATFEAWVYLTSPPDGLASIINKWSQSADDEYLFGVALNRRLHFAWKTTGATTWGNTSYNETTADAGQLAVGVWTHVAVVRAGATLTFYINGDVVATAPVMDANPFRDGRNTLRIGGQGRGAVSPYFPGFIDDVRIYNRALTQEDIQRDMNTPIGGGG